MSHPFFQFFQAYRQSPERLLFNPDVSRIKRYPLARMQSLPAPVTDLGDMTTLLRKRRSWRDFADMTISDADLSTILYWSMSEQIYEHTTESPHRPYPSGGAKYPIEAYIARVETEGVVLSHYRPDLHQLEILTTIPLATFDQMRESYVYDFVRTVPAFIWFSTILERNMPKYGSLAFKLAMIESGHIAQNIMLASQSVGVETLPLAGGDTAMIEQALQLDGYNESIMYSIGLGKRYAT